MTEARQTVACDAPLASDVLSEPVSLRQRIEHRLGELLSFRSQTPKALDEAMRYSMFSAGKRVRPVLAMVAARHFGGHEDDALDFACAIEMVHTASLILDDLPSMDNAAIRRRRETLHVAFGEDVALLTAIALLSQAFGVIAGCHALPHLIRLRLVQLLSDTIGFSGLAAGQMRDLRDEVHLKTVDGVTTLNHQKTGVLFVAAVEGGAAIAGASEDELHSAQAFARNLGLAFQLYDDLLDATSTLGALGKDAGKDSGKRNVISLLGVEETRNAVRRAVETALAPLNDGPLKDYSLRLFATVTGAPA
jgi:geranylgeranyl pyrophosphate synthase